MRAHHILFNSKSRDKGIGRLIVLKSLNNAYKQNGKGLKLKKMTPMDNLIRVIIATQHDLLTIQYKPTQDTVIVIQRDSEQSDDLMLQQEDVEKCLITICDHSAQNHLDNKIIFLSKFDNFIPEKTLINLYEIVGLKKQKSITLLIPYKSPPIYGHRDDGELQSAIISNQAFNVLFLKKAKGKFCKFIYYSVYDYLNKNYSSNIETLQIGKPTSVYSSDFDELLKDSILIMPHKGSVKLLSRSLRHINQTADLPGQTNLCFDDLSYKRANKGLMNKWCIYLNSPINVGPYLPRHFSMLKTQKDFIFFHDSDDISIERRFKMQINELKIRELDMIGSHELRIDQFSKTLKLIRFPLDVNKALAEDYCHPLYHPSSLITKKAYLKAKGFSTDRRFGNDTQFLIRSSFSLKIGNIDDFLYIRFKRPNSLTTSPETRLGSDIRNFLLWRWATDFKLVQKGKLKLEKSSLTVKEHKFDYDLQELNNKKKKHTKM